MQKRWYTINECYPPNNIMVACVISLWNEAKADIVYLQFTHENNSWYYTNGKPLEYQWDVIAWRTVEL